MKLLKLFLTIVFIFQLFHSFGQDSISNNSFNENHIILDIREKFKLINDNQYTKYKMKRRNVFGYSSEGAEIITFQDNEELRKVNATYYGEGGKAIIDYYFWNDSIFFIFHQFHMYNSQIYVTKYDSIIGLEVYDPDKTTVSENRYYFYKNKLIRWLDPKKNKVDKLDNIFNEKELELIDDVDQLLNEILKK